MLSVGDYVEFKDISTPSLSSSYCGKIIERHPSYYFHWYIVDTIRGYQVMVEPELTKITDPYLIAMITLGG